MRRWFFRSLLGLLILLVLLLAAVVLIVGTTPGSRWLVNRVAPTVGVDVGTVEGTLLHDLTLKRVHYQLGEQHYRADRLRLAWRASALWIGVVSIADLEADGLAIVIPAGEDEAEPAGEPTWPSIGSPLPIRVDRLVVNGLDLTLGEARYQLDRARAAVEYGPTRARLSDLRVTTAASEAALDARLGLSYPYQLTANIKWVLAPPADSDATHDVTRLLPEALLAPEFAGRLEAEGDITQLALSAKLRTPEALNAEAKWTTGLGRQAQPPSLSAELQLPGLSLSRFVAQEPLAAGEVSATVKLDGWLDNYQLDGGATLAMPDYPDIRLQAEAEGDMQGISIAPATLTMDDAKVEFAGDLGWQQGVSWQASLVGSGLDPAVVHPDWPGQLQLEADSSGRLAEGELTMETHIRNLSGQLRTLAVDARAQVNTQKGEWQLADGYLAVGANRLNFSGSYGESYALNWDLAAPLLASIDPMLGGSLRSQGSASGSGSDVALSFTAEAESLQLGDYQVEHLALDAREQTLEDGSATLDAQGLEVPGLTIETLHLTMDGGPQQHQVEAEITLDDFQKMSIGFAGELDGAAWRGEVNTLTLTSAYTRTMALAEPFALEASAEAVRMAPVCLQDRRGDNGGVETRLCASLAWQAGGEASGDLSVERLPLALAQNWLEPGVSLSGYLTGDGQWRQQADTPGRLELQLSAVDGALHYQYDEEETDTYPLDDLSVHLTLEDQQLQARAATVFGNYGSARATLEANLANREFDAEAQLKWQDLSPLEALLPEVHDVKGAIDASVNASGSFSQPVLTANAQLREGGFYLPGLGTRFTDVTGDLSGDQDALDLTMDITAGEGKLALEANVQDLFADWRLEASLTGESAQIMATPMLNVRVTPDLTVSGKPGELRLRGSARVPYARAEINTLPASATRVSEDVIVVDGEEAAGAQGGMKVYTNIELVLGDDVTFNAAGLEAKLGGRLRLSREPGRPLYTLGQIDIVRGRFESYGQDLTVERGALAFNGPVDNPGLDITATRTTEDYVAGIIIGGTLQNPTSEVFARPAVSESDAMAILFTGKPLSETSSSDQSMLVTAVANYGLNRGGSFIGGFSDDIGLDELTIKTGDEVNDSQLWLGKHITPKLYVHYAIGLFEQVSSMGFTYILNDHFRIEAESGEQQSADLMFEMER